ncbi:hypothetical protein BGX24_008694 [Mortierella sp. AD032]|nr:hypothetical protein BGX24_008694 [Mortierella sp. AD032]
MISAKTFIARLHIGIMLDAHIQNYLSSIVDAQSFANLLALSDDTEHFLVDTGIDDNALEASGLTKITLTKDHDQQNGEAESDSSGSDDKKTGSASPQSKKSFKSKPVKLTKAAKKLAAKSSSTASSPGTPSSAVFNGAGGVSSGENALVEACSQQSRFYEVITETLSKEVDLQQVNINIGGQPLLQDTRLWFKSGTIYGLIGRNGTGKSTLLKAIGYGELIGFPLNIRTLYIEQLPPETPDERTVVETVLKANMERTLLMSEYDLLQKAINKYPRQLVKSIKNLDWERMKVRLAAQLKLATRRSGKRGAEARKELLVVEAEEKAVQEAFAAIPIEGVEPPLDVVNQAHEFLESVYNKLLQIEAESAEARVRELLRGLGFTPANQDLPINMFSGGWKMRIALAQALFLKPDLLLLDEPTKDNQTIVVVSHDRNFLNTVSQEINRLRDYKLGCFPSNYDEYEMKLEDKAKMKDRISAALEKKRKHAQDTINKQRSIMNRTGDDKRGAVIASRQKSYIPGFHFNMGLLVVKEAPEPSVTIPLPAPKELRGHLTTLLSLNNVTFAYPGAPALSKPVIQNVSLSLHRSSRIALVGPNGCGKSTLMSLLSGEVLPTSGSVEKFSPLVRIGYFSQHNVKQLDGEASKSAMKYLMDTFPDEYKSEPMARKYFGSFGIAGQTALLPMSTLSGGQKVRVALAICVNGGPQVLLLDEITNHLDMATIQGLIVALKEFSGAVVLVSHDAYFIKAVCEGDDGDEDYKDEDDEGRMLRAQEEDGVVYRVKNGKPDRLEGEVDEYVKTVVAEKKGMRGGAGCLI